jgi:hypothetical protein
MSVPYLKEAAATGEMEKLIRFVRLRVGDGNEEVGRKEIDKPWIEALKIACRREPHRERPGARRVDAGAVVFPLAFLPDPQVRRVDS